MKKKLLILGVVLSFMDTYAQKLERSKENLKKDLNYHITNSQIGTDENDNSTSNSLAYDLIAKPIMFIGGFLTYGLLIETFIEREKKHAYMELTPYPYINNLKGDYAFEANEVSFTRFDISNQFVTDMNYTQGNNLNIKFRFLERVNIEYNQLYLLENNNNQFFMHDLTANYYRIRTEHMTLNYGMGISYVHSGVNKAYFTYNTGIQYFFNIPLSLSLDHRGTPFSRYGIYQTKLNFNYHIKQFVFQVGINFYNIGNVHYKMLGLGGKVYL
ncbi:hypothetical protein [Wenyingzhuangia sp. IMCC45467]